MALPDILTQAVPLGSSRSAKTPTGHLLVSDPRTLRLKAASFLTLTRLYVSRRLEATNQVFSKHHPPVKLTQWRAPGPIYHVSSEANRGGMGRAKESMLGQLPINSWHSVPARTPGPPVEPHASLLWVHATTALTQHHLIR